jgi:hypothetical protein
VKTIRTAVAGCGESPSANAEIHDGNDATSDVLLGCGDTDRFSHSQPEVRP